MNGIKQTIGTSIYYKDGKVTHYHESDVVRTDPIGAPGMFYIQLKDAHKVEKPGKLETVKYRRIWIPLANVRSIETTNISYLEGENIEKYHKFRTRGIDITKTAISGTLPKTEAPKSKKPSTKAKTKTT